jgi:hypothetical protein
MSGGRTIYTYEATLRFVCWLSMKKLGYDTTEGTSDFVLDTIRTIQNIKIDTSTIPGVRKAWIRFADQLKRDHQLIFGKYSYGNQSDLFVYPYDFFAINAKLTIEMTQKCNTALEARAAINC